MTTPGSEDKQLTVYFDRSCSLCRDEIETLKRADAADRLALVDCSVENFEDDAAREAQLDQTTMLSALHIRDADGRWYRGVDAFAELYRAVGLTGIARLWGSRRLSRITKPIYRLIARHRGFLKKSGIGHGYVRVVEWLLRRRSR